MPGKNACLSKEECGGYEFQAVNTALLHRGGQDPSEVTPEGGRKQCVRSEGRKNGVVTLHGTGHFAGVEDVALHHFQSLVHLADFLGGADVGRNKMTALQRQANEMPANAARSAKNEQFHGLVSLEGGSAALAAGPPRPMVGTAPIC
jgi:hypothetical protein